MVAVRKEADGVILEVKVKPNSRRTEIKSLSDDEEVTIAVGAVADKEKANKELVKFLSGLFGIPKDNVSIMSGQHTSRKRIKLVIDTSTEDVVHLIKQNIRD